MLTLNDGRSELWQWDTGRKLNVDADCSQVHFSNKVFGRSIDVDVVDGVATIPDILLQTDKELTAWAFVGTAENGYTKISKVFKVNKRNKPANYVFTAPDQTTLGEILDRIEDLENRPSGDVSKEDIQNAVSDYLDKNPVSVEEKDPTVPAWAKQPEPPKVELPTALPNPHKLTFTGAVEAEYDGSEKVEVEIPEGGSGGIPIPETAEVGQTIVVKAVDENGKPTEWECAELYQELPVLFSITLTEATTTLEITTDSEGNALSLDEWDVIVHIPGTTTYEPKIFIYAVDGDTVGWSFAFAYNDKGANNVLRYRSHGTNFIEAMACKYTSAAHNQHWMKYSAKGVHSSGIKIYTYNSGNTPMPVGTYIEIRGK